MKDETAPRWAMFLVWAALLAVCALFWTAVVYLLV